MNTKLLLASALTSVFFSCQSKKEKLAIEISKNESRLFNDSTKMLDAQVAYETLQGYEKFVNTFPDDTASPGYLYKAADLAQDRSPDRHIGPDRVADRREPIRQSRVAASEYPVELAREPLGLAGGPAREQRSPGTDRVSSIEALFEAGQPVRLGAGIVVDEGDYV